MKIGHDLAEKKFVPGLGWGRGQGRVGDWFSLSLRIGLSRSIDESTGSEKYRVPVTLNPTLKLMNLKPPP